MACLFAQLLEIEQLRSPVSLAEWVNVIDVTDDGPGCIGEPLPAQSLEKMRLYEPCMNIPHAGRDVPAKLELLAAFGELNRTEFACPIEDVLEQMSVDRAQMGKVEIAGGYPFPDSLRDEPALDYFELAGIGESEFIAKDRRACEGVRIVHSAASDLWSARM
jgi:hypothetical protein